MMNCLLGLGGRLALAACLSRRRGVDAGLRRRAVSRGRCRVVVAAGGGLGEAVLELGEQGLVLLVEQQGRLAQPLVLLHDVAVMQVQLRVQPLHLPLQPAAAQHKHTRNWGTERHQPRRHVKRKKLEKMLLLVTITQSPAH
jgi:hypothetical protein